ncbi:MAG: competence protein CoiA family protein [Deinococcota bacterium]
MARAVPYAADADGRLADPATAEIGPFFCLECHEPVSLRREHLRQGRVVVAHFSHKPGSTCAGESVLHLAAKMRLVEALTNRERPFVIRRVCQRFGCEATHNQPWEPPAFDHAAEEIALGAYRLDVAAMQGDSVVLGFEVYHSHRVGRVKAARLRVPWLELQAESTARDPYVLCLVVDELITGEDEQDLRWALNVTRAELPEKLAWRLSHPTLLDRRLNGTAVPSRLVNRIFQARREGSNVLRPWLCPACADGQATQTKLRGVEVERQAVEAQERQRQEHERQQVAQSALIDQQALFGPGLQQPFEADDVEFFHQGAAVFRFAVQYLRRPPHLLLEHFEENTHDVLVAKRCWHCHRPILCLDSSDYVGAFRIYYPWVEYFKPPEGKRGYLISKCRQCEKRQRQQGLYQGKYVTLEGHHLAKWLRAFHPTAQPDQPRLS